MTDPPRKRSRRCFRKICLQLQSFPLRFKGTETGFLIWLVPPHSTTSWTAQEESCRQSEWELSMDVSCSSTEQLQCGILISVVLTSMSIERRPKSNSLFHPRPCGQLQGKWGGIARISYSTHTVLSLSQSSDEDKSLVTTCGLQAVLRPLHLASTVPLQAASSTTRDAQGSTVLRHRCGFHSTPVNRPMGSWSHFTVLSPHRQKSPSPLPGTSSPLLLARLVSLHKERDEKEREEIRHAVRYDGHVQGELERRETSKSLARTPRRKVRVRGGEEAAPTDPYKPHKGFAIRNGYH